ncbi:MAG: AMP-binding protein [Proteobacteria bacterium]|nr:AMP-binding protein [Pseudomonadota bacterium]
MTPIVLDFLAHNARVWPAKEALVELATGRRWSWSDFDRDARRAETVLRTRVGSPQGVRIAMLSRNCAAMLIVQQACIRSGAIFVPLNWRLAAPEIAFLLDDCEPALLIHEEGFESLLPAPGSCPRMVIGQTRDELAEAMASCAATDVGEGRRLDPESPITILYSSGTTGKPKGAVVSLLNGFTGALGLALATNASMAGTLLLDMPLFHTAGLFGSGWSMMLMGGRVLISQKFEAPVTYERLADPKLGVTHYFSVTQMAMSMRQLPGFDGRRLARLTAYVTGGSPNPEAHHRTWLEDGVMMLNGFGMSETCSSTATPIGDLEILKRKAGTVGVSHLALELRIVRPDGTDAGVGEVGELWCRGASVTTGYWKRPELNKAAFTDGWFRSGDAALRDADGYYMLVDRLKDMFISGGENVYPAEVEAVLSAMPGVGDMAVIGVPDERWGEVGCAYVVPAAGVHLTEQQVVDHCGRFLARYKVPKQVVITDRIERTASGKSQKHLLLARWRAQSGGAA